MEQYDCVITGSGPSGLGAAFEMIDQKAGTKILILEKESSSTGGLRNDCKMNFSYPIGFPEEYWSQKSAEYYLDRTHQHLAEFLPPIMEKKRLPIYSTRAAQLGVELLSIRQVHFGTDGGLKLIKTLTEKLQKLGVELSLKETLLELDPSSQILTTDKRKIGYRSLILAPGRKGFLFLQNIMKLLNISYVDNNIDIGIRLEMLMKRYPIVMDYYDPKFLFPMKVRTFCTNSRSAYVVREHNITSEGAAYYSVNGHAWSDKKRRNGLVNFAMLKSVRLSEPLVSGQRYAEMLGVQAKLLGGGEPLAQRVGDFRLGKRSKSGAFTGDLFDFPPTLQSATPGDLSLAVPGKILRDIWRSMKRLDTIIPGVLHPSTIMYYPEIKLYANKPQFRGEHFQVTEQVFMIGDGAGTSRGITAAWASGIRAAQGVIKILSQ